MGFALFIIYELFFLFFQTGTIYGGDGGDLVTAALTGGFAHAPGYPLYSLLGYLFTKIPYSTPAWRVSFLSSLPAAATLTLVYLFIQRTTSSRFAGIISSITLGLTYVFWLYSVVPEVFVLAICFTMAIFYTLYVWSQTGSKQLFFLAVFLFSLSLTHHHIILFMVPAYAFLVFKNRKQLPKKNARSYALFGAMISIGFLPYLWLPISSYMVAAHTWGDPDTFVKFMKIVTRAYYGTFIAAQDYNQSLADRLQQIPILARFYIEDFSLPAVLTALVGMFSLYKTSRNLFFYIFIAFVCTGPLFFVYASYNHTTPYQEAVAERFLLPSYLMIALFFGFGIAYIDKALRRLLTTVRPAVTSILLIGFLLIPAYLGLHNYYKISVLKNDSTAENFAYDILSSSTKGSPAIFLLQNDNSIFNTQYVHNWKRNEYQNAIPLNPAELSNGFSRKMISKYYPNIVLPSDPKYHPVADFIRKNYDSYEIYTDLPDEYKYLEGINKGIWVPYGLIYRYYKNEDLPLPQDLVAKNMDLWEGYSNPLQGSLSKYKSLQLEHVLEFYQYGQLRSAVFALEAGLNENALEHIRMYEKLEPGDSMVIGRMTSASTYISLDRCGDAEKIIRDLDSYKATVYYELMYNFATRCEKDEKSANVWKKKLLDFERNKQQELQEL